MREHSDKSIVPQPKDGAKYLYNSDGHPEFQRFRSALRERCRAEYLKKGRKATDEERDAIIAEVKQEFLAARKAEVEAEMSGHVEGDSAS